jgi:hypothetical protein
VSSQLAKVFVDEWKLNKTIDACVEWSWSSRRDEYEGMAYEEAYKEWKKKIKQLAMQSTRDAQDRGVAVHDALEQFFLTGAISAKFESVILGVKKLFERELSLAPEECIAERSFSYLGYGGCVDLHSTRGNGLVLDFKVKNVDSLDKITPYPEHSMQLAAYRHGLNIPNADCYNLFINVDDKFKLKELKLCKHKEEDLSRYYKGFLCLRDYFYLSNNMEMTYE